MGRKGQTPSEKRHEDGRPKSPRRRKATTSEHEVTEVPPLRKSQSEVPPQSGSPSHISRSSSDASPARGERERGSKERSHSKRNAPGHSTLPSLSGAMEMLKANSPSMKKRSKSSGKSSSRPASSDLKKVRSGSSSRKSSVSSPARKNSAGSTPRKSSLGSAVETAELLEVEKKQRPLSGVQLVTDAVSKMEVAVGLDATNDDEREAMIALQPLVNKLRRKKPGLRASFRRQDSVGQEYLLNLQPRSLCKSKLAKPSTASCRSLTGEVMDDMKALKVERKRIRVVNEMHSTETTYFEALQTVITLFIAPLKKSMLSDVPLLTQAEFDLSFQNIEDIRVVNGELLKQLSKRKQCPEEMIWCDILVDWLSKPEVTESYQRYINGYEHARKFLFAAMKSSEEFAALSVKERDRVVKEGGTDKDGKYAHLRLGDFIRGRLSHDLCGGFGSITSFLITPVQRLPRYLLFLRELDELTPATHPDREFVERSYELLKRMTGKIDERKNVYDAIYHKEALLMSFQARDQLLLQDITHADRRLLAEGPLVEGDNVHYVLIFVDLIVCGLKSENGLELLWRASTYTDQIEVRASEDGEYLYVVEGSRFATYPFFTKTHHVLYPFAEGMFNIDFWSPHFQALIDAKRSQAHCASLAASLTNRLAGILMPFDAWDELSLGMKTRAVVAGKTVLRQGEEADLLVLVREGEVELSLCIEGAQLGSTADVVHVLGTAEQGHLLAEQFLLERRPGKLNFSARSLGFAKFTEMPLKALHQRLAERGELGVGFYHLVALITGTRYLRVLADEARPYAAILPVLSSSYATDTEKHTKAVVKLTSIPAAEAHVHDCFPCYLNAKKRKKNMVELMVTTHYLCLLSEKKCIHQTRGATVTVNSCSSGSQMISLHLPKTRGLVELYFPDPYTFANALRSLEALIMRCADNLPHVFEPRDKVDLSDEDWDVLMTRAKEKTFHKGDVIVSAGAFSEHIFQLLEGSCTATFQTCQGEECARVRVGELFGEVSFLFGVASTASVIASSTVLVQSIPHVDIALALHENPGLAAGFFKLLSCVTKRRLEKVQTTRLRSQALGSSTSESDSLK